MIIMARYFLNMVKMIYLASSDGVILEYMLGIEDTEVDTIIIMILLDT